VKRFLVNPSAGRGKSHRALSTLQRLSDEAESELRLSRSAEDLVEQARQAVADGVTRLLVAGGDGTFHYVAQSLVGSGCALGVIPLGRGNDFATDLGVPLELEAAIRFALAGPVRRIDVGRVNNRFFTGYCGVGFDSEAAQVAQRAPAVFSGPFTYVYSVLRTMLTFRPPTLSVQLDGGEFQGKAMFAVACNISRFGGGMRIAPDARVDDGALDLVIVKELGKIQLLQVFPKVYSGKHVGHPAVQIARTQTATVSVDRSMTVACDGEPIGRTDGNSLEVSLEPLALSVIGEA